MRAFIIYIAVIFLPSVASGIVFTDREYVLNPLTDKVFQTGSGVTFFNNAGLFAAFGHSIQDTNSNYDHYWDTDLSGFLELVNLGGDKDIVLAADMEMAASPMGWIQFSPRAIFWTENILYSQSIPFCTIQTGFYQRCKHDVDNLEQTWNGSSTGEQRDVIFSSIPLRVILDPARFQTGWLGSRLESVFYIKNDFYVILQDSYYINAASAIDLSNSSVVQEINNAGSDNLNSLIDSITIGIHNKYYFPGIMGIYLNLQAVIDFFGSQPGWNARFEGLNYINSDWYLEAGIFPLTKYFFSIFITAEYQSDTLIHPYPDSTMMIYAGLKTMTPDNYE